MNNNDLFNGIIDVPNETNIGQKNSNNNYVEPRNENLVTDNVQSLQQNNQYVDSTIPVNSPNFSSNQFSNIQQETVKEEKQIDYETLKNLTADTNNFVNPDLIVNPSLTNLEEQPEILTIEEEKVEHNKKKNKRNYIFTAILIAIIALFIIFLPKIVTLIG